MAKSPWAATRRPILRRLRSDDSGQALVLVMFISIMSILMLTTATNALTNQIRPAAASADAGRAMAAAQAGVENFVSWVNTNCPPNSGYLCANLHTGVSNTAVTDPANQPGTQIVGADGARTNEYYTWTVVYAASGFARVRSIGQVPSGKSSPAYRTTTLVADINAVPSFNNFQYYTKYETYSPEFLESFYGQRNIQITPGFDLTGTSIGSGTTSTGGVLSWSGVCDTTTTPGCDPNHSADICNDLYYPNPTGPGRGTDSAWNNALRRPSAAIQSQLGTDNSFAYYSEPGSYTPASGAAASVTHNDVCDSTMEPNMVMNGPIYSQDAYLIDRGKPTGAASPSMPNIGGAAYSLWNGVINNTQQPVGINGGYDRAYPGTDGQAYLTNTYPAGQVFPIYESRELDLPADATDALPEAACIYTGPTRIKLVNNIADITSPLTPAGTSACYQSTGSFSNVSSSDSSGQSNTDPSGGVIDAQVPINNTIIYVKNAPSSVTRSLATKTNPVFSASTTIPSPPNSQSDGLAGTWTDQSTYSSTTSCPSPADVTKRRNFDCETGTGTPKPDVFTQLKAAVDAELAKSAPTTASLTAVIKAQLSTASQAAIAGNGSISYSVSVTAAAPNTTTQTPTAPTDSFFRSATGTGYSTTVSSWTATITRTTCTSVDSKNNCNATTSTPIVTGPLSTTRSVGTLSQSTESFPWFGTSYTDPNNDVTQYYHGYGDAYVEGTLKGEASIIAEHDVLITNDVLYSNTTTSTTTDGLALVATHNVRAYRPMTCVNAGNAGTTTPGYCPDDTEGVYTAPLAWPMTQTNNLLYPSNAYTPTTTNSLTTGVNSKGQVVSRTGTVYATIFALRGSFIADNFYRGIIGTGINVYGGMYQYHRGATSLPYQNRPYQGSGSKMPGMVVTYNYDNMRAGNTTNGGLRIPYIPTPQGRQTANTWVVLGMSTGS